MRTFAPRSTNSYPIAWLEQACLGDGVVYLSLEHIEEAFLAYLLPSLWSFEDGPGVVTESACAGRHDRRSGASSPS